MRASASGSQTQAAPRGQVALVQVAAPLDLAGQALAQGARQHDHTVLGAFAVAHQDLAAVQVEVVDAHPAGFQEA